MVKNLTVVDVNKAVVERLKNGIPNHPVYAAEVIEGFKRPCFFTQILMPTSSHETINRTFNRRIVIIHYFSENGTELENLMMYSRLEQIFGLKLRVKNRMLNVENVRSDIADGVLQFKFDLDFYTRIEREDEYELMQELKLNQRGEG